MISINDISINQFLNQTSFSIIPALDMMRNRSMAGLVQFVSPSILTSEKQSSVFQALGKTSAKGFSFQNPTLTTVRPSYKSWRTTPEFFAL